MFVISPLRRPIFSMTVPIDSSGTSTTSSSTGSLFTPSISPEDHLGAGEGELERLAPHVLDQDRQVELAAARDLEGVRGVGLLHAEGHVGPKLLLEPLPDVAAGDVFP